MSIRICALSVLAFAVACSAPPTVDPGKDETAPRVLAIFPADGATSVARNAVITVVFSEPVDGIAEGVTVEGASGAVVADADKLVATFTPAANYAPGATLEVHVTSAVRDAAGNALSEKTSSFTVASDDSPPTVTSTTPAHGATGVSVASPISVVLSEPLLDSSVTASAIEVDGVVGTVTYAAAENTVTLTPGAALPHGSKLVATAKGLKDLAGNELAPFRWSFTTAQETTAPTVASVTPANGSTNVAVNSAVTVVFSEAMDPSTITAANLQLGAVAVTVAYDVSSRTATVTPVSPLAHASSVSLQINTGVKDLAGNALAQAFASSFTTVGDTTAPTIVSRLPEPNANGVSTAGSVVVTFSEPMDSATFTPSSVGIVGVSGTVSYDANARAAIFTPSQPLAESTSYTAFVTAAKDAAGNAVADASWSFTTSADNAPPTIIWTSPGANATNVQVSAQLRVMFSEPIAPATLTPSSFTVSAGSTPISGTLAYDAVTRTATFDAAAPFKNSTVITVAVTNAITDATGNALAQPLSFSFTTEADLIPPTVTATLPANNSVDAGTLAPITVFFSEAMDPSSVGSALTLSSSAGSPSGTATWSAANNALVFTPASRLQHLTQYTATVSTAATDVAGNSLRSPVTFKFTTEADSTPPTIASSTPPNGATNVSLSTNIRLFFSEPMSTNALYAITLDGAPTYFGTYNNSLYMYSLNAGALEAGRTYTVTVPTSVTDANGVAFAAPATITFSTVPDTTPPTVQSVSPSDGLRMVSTSSPPAISVTFNERMDPATINSTTLAVTGTTGSWALDQFAQRTATFTPSGTLPAKAQITVGINGVKDRSGNALAAPTQFSFFTASTPVMLPVAPGNAYTTDAMAAFAPSGDGVATWISDTGSSRRLLYARYLGGAWQSEQVLDTCIEGRWLQPELVAATANGFAVSYFPCESGYQRHQVAVLDNGTLTKRMLTARAQSLLTAGNSYALLIGDSAGGTADVYDGASGLWSSTQLSYPTYYAGLASSGSSFALVGSPGNLEARIWSNGSWGAPQTLLTVAGAMTISDFEVQGGGGTFAVLAGTNDNQIPATTQLRGFRYDGASWSAPAALGTQTRSYEINGSAASGSNALFAVGLQGQPGLTAHYLSGTTWSVSTVTTASASSPMVAMDGSAAVIGWYSSSGFTVVGGTGTSWGTPLTPSGASTGTPSLASRPNEIVLYRTLSSPFEGETRSFTPAGGWSSPVSTQPVIDPYDSLVRRGPSLVGVRASSTHLYESVYSGTWTTPAQRDTQSFPSSALGLKVASVGARTVATWKQSTNPAASSSAPNDGVLHASAFDGTTWSPTVQLSSGPIDFSSIAANTAGTRAIVGWNEGNPNQVNIRAYDVATGTWSPVVQTNFFSGGVPFRLGHDGTQFVLLGGTFNDLYESTSVDGLTWSTPTNLTATLSTGYVFIDAVVSGSSRAILSTTGSGTYLSTFNGGVWGDPTSISASLGAKVMVGDGAGGMLAILGSSVSSFNGSAWVYHSFFTNCPALDAKYQGGTYLASCNTTSGTSTPYRYANSQWTADPVPNSSSAVVGASVGGVFVWASASGGTLDTSTAPLLGQNVRGGPIDIDTNLFEPKLEGGSELRLVYTKTDPATGARRVWFSRGN